MEKLLNNSEVPTTIGCPDTLGWPFCMPSLKKEFEFCVQMKYYEHILESQNDKGA